MEAVHESLRVLGVTDAGDAPAIRAAYLRLVGAKNQLHFLSCMHVGVQFRVLALQSLCSTGWDLLKLQSGSTPMTLNCLTFSCSAGKWHPDKFQKEEDKVNATKHFREVSDAYNILRKT